MANEVPLVLVCPYELVTAYDPEGLVADCAASGLDGLLVPDLPYDAISGLKAHAEQAGIDLPLQAAGDSREIGVIAELASGFVYINVDAVGAWESLVLMVEQVRRHSKLPCVIGPDAPRAGDVAHAISIAEGVVTGPSLDVLAASLPEDDLLGGVAEYVREMKAATLANT
jgi:tryptophan synthase alpha chain